MDKVLIMQGEAVNACRYSILTGKSDGRR